MKLASVAGLNLLESRRWDVHCRLTRFTRCAVTIEQVAFFRLVLKSALDCRQMTLREH